MISIININIRFQMIGNQNCIIGIDDLRINKTPQLNNNDSKVIEPHPSLKSLSNGSKRLFE